MKVFYGDNGKTFTTFFKDFNKLEVRTDGKRGIVARFENFGNPDGCDWDFWSIAIERAADGYRYFDNGFAANGASDVMTWVWGIYDGFDEDGLEERELELVDEAVQLYEKSLQKMATL